MIVIFCISCHDEGPDPIDNPNDPMDTTKVDTMKVDTLDTLNNPIDTLLMKVFEKWGGDYLGDRIEKHIYKTDTTIDTLHNLILKVKSITRDSMYSGYFSKKRSYPFNLSGMPLE